MTKLVFGSGLSLSCALALFSVPALAQPEGERSLVEQGRGGRTGACLIGNSPWRALGWAQLDDAPIRALLPRSPAQETYRDVHKQTKATLHACSTQLEQRQVQRDKNRNVWTPEIYITASGFGSGSPTLDPIDVEMSFRQARKKRGVFYMDSMSFVGKLAQGRAWQKALEKDWGTTPHYKYNPPGVYLRGNIYGDIYNSTPTDEWQAWYWQFDGNDTFGNSVSNYSANLSCNITQNVCRLRLSERGSIPVWSPLFAQYQEELRQKQAERRRRNR